MPDILQAARSYYGLADTDVRKTDIYTNEAGQPMLVFEIAFTNDEFFGIADRMKAMNQAEAQEQPDTAIIEGPTVEAMREAYNALSKAEKGRYGSFARYMAESSTGIIDVYTGEPYENLLKRDVVHVDTPEEPAPTSMDAVWLPLDECSEAQKQFAVDWSNVGDEAGPQLLIQWAMLTDEQKQKAKQSQEQNVTLDIKGIL